MTWIISLLEAWAGPRLAKWAAGIVAAVGGVLALLVARRRGRAQGRAEVEAENARAAVRKRDELAAVRARQLEAANKRPARDELDEILEEGRF